MEKIFKSIKNDVMNTPMDGYELAAVFQSALHEYGVEVTINASADMTMGDVTVAGFFNSYDWEDEQSIELALIVNNESDDIVINNEKWAFLEHQAKVTLEHEIIHREQTSQREGLVLMPDYDSNMTPEQEKIIYLSDPDEIDAYSNDIALDLVKAYGNKMKASLALSKYTTIKKESCPILVDYIGTFGSDSTLVKTIIKKAMKRIQS